MEKKPPPNSLLSLKTVIRTKDFAASKAFYTEVLRLETVQEYDDGDGARGIILRFGPKGSDAMLEISEISAHHEYYQSAFNEDFRNDKADIQLRTNDISHWAERLKGKWSTRGPMLRPWGWHYLYLRDPDGLQIIIYQERN